MKKIIISLSALATLLFAIPATAYTVHSGDTLSKIAASNHTTVAQIATANGIKNVNKIFSGQELVLGASEAVLGANPATPTQTGYNPVTAYSSRTSQYVTISATTIPVASTLDKQGNQIVLTNISSAAVVKVYMSLGAGTSTEEPIVCTGLTATSWTGCTRGLRDQSGDETGSSTLAYAHNAGTSIIITNVGQFFNQFVSIDGNQTINGAKTLSGTSTFTFSPVLSADTTTTNPAALVTFGQLSRQAISGAANSSETVNGISQLATQAQAAAGTSLGSTGARLVLPASMASSTGGSTTTVVVTNASGTIASTFGGGANSLAQTNSFGVLTNASTSPAANSIPISNASGTLHSFGMFGGNGSDGALSVTSGATNIDLGGAEYVEKNYSSISITGSGSLTFSNSSATGTFVVLRSQNDCILTSTATIEIDARAIGATSSVGSAGGNTVAGNVGKGLYGISIGAGGAVTGGSSVGTGGVSPIVPNVSFDHLITLFTGAGGSGGAGGSQAGGRGGKGGGALYLECGGSWNFPTSSVISAAGEAGTNGVSQTAGGNAYGGGGGGGAITSGATATSGGSEPVSGGGGGGGGGTVYALYNYLISNGGTISVSGGTGGVGTAGVGNAGAGGKGFTVIKKNSIWF